jgi:lipopolysaccharide transport system ATP-binding protein
VTTLLKAVPSRALLAPASLVRVEGAAKRYPLFGRRRDRMLALLGRQHGIAHKVAVGGVSFTVEPSEALGIIGENGSGKSTLLRMVAGISEPDAGLVEVAQPVAAILELGLGFHPDFTGRENAMLYGTLVGIPEAELRERLGDILAFAELGEFIDQPLRTYSSGMVARLAFSVATNVEPAVLLVDEALAVGDSAFQKKCVDRMVRFKAEGRAVLFCSHAMYLVAGFCDRALWLRDGQVAAIGPTFEVIRQYDTYLATKGKRVLVPGRAPEGGGAPGPRHPRLDRVTPRGLSGGSAASLAPGEGLVVDLDLAGLDPAAEYHVAVAIDEADGDRIFVASTHHDRQAPLQAGHDRRVTLRIPALPLGRGTYLLLAFLMDGVGVTVLDQVVLPGAVGVDTQTWVPGLLHVEHEWSRSS